MPSHVLSAVVWFRRPSVWLAGSAWLAAAGGLAVFGRDWPAAVQLAGWGLLLAALLWLLRARWGRLLGPVLFYDLVSMARRPRFMIIRGLYALALLLMLFLVFKAWQSSRNVQVMPGVPSTAPAWPGSRNIQVMPGVQSGPRPVDPKELIRLAQTFFTAFLSIQFLAVLLLTPAYTAGAVAEEKDRRTLEFLLATDLSNREIILSKLLARVANLTLIILTGLPILSLMQFWGGVDPELVLAGFVATGLIMLSLASVSILTSVYARKPREAMVLTYLAMAGYLIIAVLSMVAVRSPAVAKWAPFPDFNPFTVGDVVSVFNAGNPMAAYLELDQALSANKPLSGVLSGLVRRYALFHGLLALVCVTWAVVQVRVVALAQGPGGRNRKRRARARRRPRIGRNPMLWKEVFAEPGLSFNWFGKAIVAGIILVSFVPALWIGGRFLYEYLHPPQMQTTIMMWPRPQPTVMATAFPWQHLADAYNTWVRLVGTLVACLILLGIGIRAASSVSGERDRQTLDALLTSPLEPRNIVFAKWLGSLVGMRWAALWLMLIWGVGLATGGLDRTTVPWLVLALVVYGTFMASLGLWFSTVWSTTTRATLGTLIAAVLAGCGHWLLWLIFFLPVAMTHREHGLVTWVTHFEKYAFTPPLVLNWLSFHGDNLRLDSPGAGDDGWMMLGAILLGLVIWGGAGCGLYSSATSRFGILAGRGRRRRPSPQPGRARGLTPPARR